MGKDLGLSSTVSKKGQDESFWSQPWGWGKKQRREGRTHSIAMMNKVEKSKAFIIFTLKMKKCILSLEQTIPSKVRKKSNVCPVCYGYETQQSRLQ